MRDPTHIPQTSRFRLCRWHLQLVVRGVVAASSVRTCCLGWFISYAAEDRHVGVVVRRRGVVAAHQGGTVAGAAAENASKHNLKYAEENGYYRHDKRTSIRKTCHRRRA